MYYDKIGLSIGAHVKEFLDRYNLNTIFKVKTAFLVGLPLAALVGLVYHFMYESWSSTLLISMIVMYALNIFVISAGYHRLFSHRAYKASWPVKAFMLFFGASTVENSALLWASDHRTHHKYEDTDKDPYNIKEGFFYAHMGWIMLKSYKAAPLAKDLQNDKMVMFQHNYFYSLVVISNLLPFFITYAITGAFIGSFTFAVLLRLVIVHHVTYCINSYCHTFGSQPYSDEVTAKDSGLISFLTFGESYHNFHHKFQLDYRNGYRWFNIDMTKWILFSWEKLGLITDLKRTPDVQVLKAMMQMKEKQAHQSFDFTEELVLKLEQLKVKVIQSKKALINLKKEYKMMSKSDLDEAAKLKLEEIKKEMKQMKNNFKFAYNQWLNHLKYNPSFS